MLHKKFSGQARELKSRLKELITSSKKDAEAILLISPDYFYYPTLNFETKDCRLASSIVLLPNRKYFALETNHIDSTVRPYSIRIIVNGASVELSQEMQTNLLRFLQIQFVPDSCDCGAFVRYLHGVTCRYYALDPDIKHYWKSWTSVKECDLKAGDAVFMETANGVVKHWAVYLTQGLYLSKFGFNGGELGVTTWEQMQHMYLGCEKNIYRVTSYDDKRGTKRQRHLTSNVVPF